MLDISGVCPICEDAVRFTSRHAWLRDHFLCSQCGSIPRERALMRVIQMYYPNYRRLAIHESSPGQRGTSTKLARECRGYTASHYFPDLEVGDVDRNSGMQCQNLEAMSFPANSFDLFITQDVMEHIFDPGAAFREIARVLKPGGAHIFTVPLVKKSDSSERRASLDSNGEIVHHEQPQYHGNPIDASGSLVTMDWGYDIAKTIYEKAGTATTILILDDLQAGIRAEYIDVLVSKK